MVVMPQGPPHSLLCPCPSLGAYPGLPSILCPPHRAFFPGVAPGCVPHLSYTSRWEATVPSYFPGSSPCSPPGSDPLVGKVAWLIVLIFSLPVGFGCWPPAPKRAGPNSLLLTQSRDACLLFRLAFPSMSFWPSSTRCMHGGHTREDTRAVLPKLIWPLWLPWHQRQGQV